MLSKLLLTEDQEEQKNHDSSRVYSKSRIKARTKQNLWNVKQERPELFAPHGDVQAPAEVGAETNVPPGFEACGQEGWWHHPGRGVFLDAKSGRRYWFDAAASEYKDIHEGKLLALNCISGAATGGGAAQKRATGSSGGGVSGKQPAPRNVIVPDLHRTAQALKAELDHLDQPASLLSVIGAAVGAETAPTEAAAHGLHVKLIRRLAAFRGSWTDDALCAAAAGALDDIAADHGTHPLCAVALIVGRRNVVAVTPGTSHCIMKLVAGSAETALAPTARRGSALSAGGSPVIAMCHELANTSEEFFVALTAGETSLSDAETASVVVPHLSAGRPRAASVALLAAHQQRSAGQRAVACARLSPALETVAGASLGPVVKHAAKRQKVEEAPGKIRVRQILVRAWRGVGQEPTDPIKRKIVRRAPEEAEAQMLQVLDELLRDGCTGFTNACKASSECQSALKGGELAGDLGWIDRDKGVDAQQLNARAIKPIIPAPVLKAALELEVGQLGDLVTSDLGTHLLLRSA
mmetsp:Transcript_114395/g.323370  ORF Transcript_114395/g.323370 Transcript_114395/m.323370 type:complete len:522 (-) Transcript_114395:73-1638(-)|eukprot:CAMPEP_0117492494 /NCGR_PEP_ID=MMETSP0784-20121206/18610_1 /TAXON_ID=39447 /ORGANISM="" /LENGTH=521 /DNA_ID=CAMNT_0005287315 /DNA_START=152 /DNA_END=1717 /DNA_ORIENTATION=+